LRLWVTDRLKNLVLGMVLGVPILLGLYWAMRTWPRGWWLAGGIGQVAFVLIVSLAGPVLVMPLFYKFRPLQDDYAELADRLTRISAAAGRRVRGVFSFDMSRRTRSANAMLVGLGGTRRILLGDTLLSDFAPDEVEAILAHELGHHVHRDIPVGIVLQGLLTTGWLWLTGGVLQAAAVRGVLPSAVDPAGLPLLMLTMNLLGLIGMPLTNAYSRWRERRADDFSVRLTGRPSAFVDAMTRLANQNLAETDPPRWALLVFGTHPPLSERIRRAEQLAGP
jgi:STE24 endopeptidase